MDQTLHWADPLEWGCFHDPDQERCTEPYIGPVPAVAHLHGGEVPSAYDGGPDSWYTKKDGQYGVLEGPGFITNTFSYPNTQEAATLWYHDHALGETRINVFSGLAGFYLLRDWKHEPTNLPGGPDDCKRGNGEDDHHDRGKGKDSIDDHDGGKRGDCPYERAIVIQDRSFDTDSRLYFPDGSNPDDMMQPPNPDVHPFWIPEYLGNAIVVNGKTWPFLEVEPRRYRLRLLNGSNARPYRLRIENVDTQEVLPIWQIGTDGGLLNAPVKVVNPPDGPGLIIAPGERADIIVDFAGLRKGDTLRMLNNLSPPFGGVDPDTTGQIMELRVVKGKGKDRSFDPAEDGAVLRTPENQIPSLNPAVTGKVPDAMRLLTLNEFEGPGGPLALLLNNSTWLGLTEDGVPIEGSEQIDGADDPRLPYATELPQVGATEIWRFANLTVDGHPLHLHLAQFQVLDRTPFDPACYQAVYDAAFEGGEFIPGDGPPNPYSEPNEDGEIGGNPPIPDGDPVDEDNCITGPPKPPAPWERGWKDTGRAPPNAITRFAVRFAPTDAPSTGYGLCPPGNVLLDNPEALPCVPQAGSNLFAFDPTAGLDVKKDAFGFPGGPGYVWHCHILDHEDNEMMRAMFVEP
ncbi:MAG: multicopper oxidase domain-containing protein [Pseudomonadota bacterium]|nr:multicopper oxidase domain-containing protein [Pseudomonadota bacterium]